MTPAEARTRLLERAGDQWPEERADPPAWLPFTALHPVREISAAQAAARSRAAHARRLAEAPDPVLEQLLADGWRP